MSKMIPDWIGGVLEAGDEGLGSKPMDKPSVSIPFVIQFHSGKKPSAVEIVDDPVVRDTYAVKCILAGSKEPTTWLVTDYSKWKTVGECADGGLESVEFESWPPKVRY